MGHSLQGRWLFAMVLITALGVSTSDAIDRNRLGSRISIAKDESTGQVVVSWSGRGLLNQTSADGRMKRLRLRSNSYVLQPTDPQMIFQLDGYPYSVNAVGYVNVSLPPGLSLIANPLRNTNNLVGTLFPVAPDGAQVMTYVDGGYEVSTFDAIAGAWSNPDFDMSVGIGFWYCNPSSETVQHTFVGEVLSGVLVNHLPAGCSMKGAMVPRGLPINDQGIPGQPGDLIHFYENDGQGGGSYNTCIFISGEGWVPEYLHLRPAQGIWIEKQQPADWVQTFSVN